MELASRIRALRDAAGLRQGECARLAGMSQSYLSQLEGGQRKRLGGAEAKALARALGVPVSAVLDGDAPLPPLTGELFPRTREFLATELPSLSPAQLAAVDRQIVGNLRTALSLLSAAAPSQPAATAMPSGDAAEPAHGSVNWPSRTMERLWSGAMQRIKVAGRATVLARPVAALEG